MPRRTGAQSRSLDAGIRWGRFTFWLVAGVFLMVGTLFAWHSTEEFLIKDNRFRVAEAEEFAGQSPNLDRGGNTLCVGFPDPSCLRGGLWPQSLSGPDTETPAATSGDRLGGRRIGIEDLAEHDKGADSRARAGGICSASAEREGRHVATRADR